MRVPLVKPLGLLDGWCFRVDSIPNTIDKYPCTSAYICGNISSWWKATIVDRNLDDRHRCNHRLEDLERLPSQSFRDVVGSGLENLMTDFLVID